MNLNQNSRTQFGALLPGQVLPAGSDAISRSHSLPIVPAVETGPRARATLQSRPGSRLGISRCSLPSGYFFLFLV
jgi:hypothetical protein